MFVRNRLQIFITLVTLAFIIWWVSFQHVVDQQGSSVNWFENTYGLVALIGSIIGLAAVKKWGGAKAVVGKALLFFSLGLFAQEVGQLVSSYYTQIAHTDLPYPSLGDVAYFGSVILYLIAALYLAKAVAIKYPLRKLSYKILAVGVPIVILAISYFVLLYHFQYDTSKPLTVLLDAGYPLGQASYISVAIIAYLLSRKMLGGFMKAGILLVIFALVVQYLSDFTFLYESHRSAYVPGKFDDLLYLIAYFVMSIAMSQFLTIYKNLKNKAIEESVAEPQQQPEAA
ncbi:MAG: hypothetical protein HY226_04620 [Candidatus Vogelbacteria bacterium]|nr:hypothetical protein [Candidatus Vogelbacteria bacterium]